MLRFCLRALALAGRRPWLAFFSFRFGFAISVSFNENAAPNKLLILNYQMALLLDSKGQEKNIANQPLLHTLVEYVKTGREVDV